MPLLPFKQLSTAGAGDSAKLMVVNGSGIPTLVDSSGDITVDNTGAFAIGASKVTNGMLAGSITTANLLDGAGFIDADGSVAFTADQPHGGNKITGLADGTALTDAVTLGQLQSGVQRRELLLSSIQLLDGTTGTGGIAPAMCIGVQSGGEFVATDIFHLSDGTTTEIWTGIAGAASADQFSIDVGATDQMIDLAARINIDSVQWTAEYVTDLSSIFASGVGDGIVIARKEGPLPGTTGDATLAGTNRFWITRVGGGSAAKVDFVNFDGELNYEAAAIDGTGAIGGADPAANQFGFTRESETLIEGDTHYVKSTDILHSWDDDGETWNAISGSGSITFAIAVSLGTNNDAGSGTDVARANHVHARDVETVQSVTPNVVTITTDLAITDTLSATPLDVTKVKLYQNGLLQTYGGTEDFTISGVTITWLAAQTAADLESTDDLIAVYTVQG